MIILSTLTFSYLYLKQKLLIQKIITYLLTTQNIQLKPYYLKKSQQENFVTKKK